jgi:hypothetical protein
VTPREQRSLMQRQRAMLAVAVLVMILTERREALAEGDALAPVATERGPVQHVSRDKVESWLSPLAARELPRGVHLTRVQAGALTLPAGARATKVLPAKLPRRAGRVHVSAAALFERDGTIVARVAVVLHLDIDRQAASPEVMRGQEVELRIERASSVIGARAIALKDLWVGDTGVFQVLSTGKQLLGQLTSKYTARVVSAR